MRPQNAQRTEKTANATISLPLRLRDLSSMSRRHWLITNAAMVVLLRLRKRLTERSTAMTRQNHEERPTYCARNTPNAQVNPMALGLKKSSSPGRRSYMVGESHSTRATRQAPEM